MPMQAPPHQRVGGYQLQQTTSEIPPATLMPAIDLATNAPVLIELSRAARDDLGQRARLTARVTRLSAVIIGELAHTRRAETIDEGVLVVSERPPGEPLDELLAREGPLEAARAAAMVAEIARALDALHVAGLVYRTLSARAVFLDGRRTVLAPPLLTRRPRQVGPGRALPDLAYAPPEELTDARCIPSGDTYALACLAFEALTGAPPFTATSNRELVSAHVSAQPPLVSTRRGDLGAGVDPILTRALAKDPGERQQTAGELARSLAAALERDDEVADLPLPERTPTPPRCPFRSRARAAAHRPRPRRERPGQARPGQGRPGRGITVALLGVAALIAIAVVVLTSGGPTTSSVPHGRWRGTLTGTVANQPFRVPVELRLGGRLAGENNAAALSIITPNIASAPRVGAISLRSAAQRDDGSGVATILRVSAHGDTIEATSQLSQVAPGPGPNTFVAERGGRVIALGFAIGTGVRLTITGGKLWGEIVGAASSGPGLSYRAVLTGRRG